MRSLIFLLLVSFNATAALSIRDLDGDWSNGFEGVYDDVLGITWLADANYAHTIGEGRNGGTFGYYGAVNFVDSLSFHAGNEWRLPSIKDSTYEFMCCNENNSAELENLYYLTLSNDLRNDLDSPLNISFTDVLGGTYSFSNVSQNGYVPNGFNKGYWYSDQLSTSNFHSFRFFDGRSESSNYQWDLLVWPVHDGDIGASPVPLPAGIYLFLSGLVGLGLMRGRNV